MKPEFVTFTGVDEYTNIDYMKKLTESYPVEWGVLFGNRKKTKFPSIKRVNEFIENFPGNLSAHLCGKYAKEILKDSNIKDIPLSMFDRIQINTSDIIDYGVLKSISNEYNCVIIFQTCSQYQFQIYKNDPWVRPLQDRSGGKGKTETVWFRTFDNYIVGYSGGISPDNVREKVLNIDAEKYWIDMESGVRDQDDVFSLEKCEKVLKTIYG